MAESPSATLNPALVSQVLKDVDDSRDQIVEMTRMLVRMPTESPKSDTTAAVRLVKDELGGRSGIEITIHTAREPIRNLVAKVRATTPGKRLILNGHLDTYPAGDHDTWTDGPFSGSVRGGRLFGRGASDMKGGVACLIHAFRTLAEMRDMWAGEVCLTLAGDEETMGVLGSQFLLDTSGDARGDAMLNADVSSPTVPRIGEKGMIWIDVFAKGKPAHGAHVHNGENAIDALRIAMSALSGLSSLDVTPPGEVARAIERARPVSEPIGGDGEAEVLKSLTVNFGRIAGGRSANLVPDRAEANADIRLPMGVTVDEVESEISRLLDPLPGIRFEIVRRYEPTWTPPQEPIVTATVDACRRVLGSVPSVNMRVGASDARLYRAAGIPSVVCGLTPHNLGGPDEYVEIEELGDVAKIHLLSALNFLAVRH
ncbi:MAG: M20/M25/M40 family metallo-hydrolase [Albidovulum sp.]|nr:M20/M25/M40 family metallo-hydrolase [Albidovulum sp.]